jgi:hypothetical protein
VEQYKHKRAEDVVDLGFEELSRWALMAGPIEAPAVARFAGEEPVVSLSSSAYVPVNGMPFCFGRDSLGSLDWWLRWMVHACPS